MFAISARRLPFVTILCLAAGWALCPSRGSAFEYTADFSTSVPPEFSGGGIQVTNKGGRPYLGPFLQEGVAFALPNLPRHQFVHVTFDLFLLRSWNGCNEYWGPDVWTCAVAGGPTLLRTTFSNCGFFTDNNEQDYPDAYPAPAGATPHPAWTGAAENQTLGYCQDWGGPDRTHDATSVYHMDWTFPHAEAALKLRFFSKLRKIDKPFGFGSFHVETVDGPAALGQDELQRAWEDLAAADPVVADAAVWRLIAAGEPAAAFVRARAKALSPEGDPHVASRISHVLEVIRAPVVGDAPPVGADVEVVVAVLNGNMT